MIEKMSKDTYKWIDSEMKKFIFFRKFKHINKKTFEIDVETRDGEILGEIKWHGAWWKYVFHPEKNCLFDSSCLKDIIEYINQLMEARKQK